MANDSDFGEIVQFTLKWEVVRNKQGKVIAEHDPEDPGGVTKYGIDKSAHPELSVSDIENLTEAQAVEIYRRENWEGTKADQLPSRFAQVVFDMSVLDGTSRGVRALQMAVGVGVNADLSQRTIDAAQEAAAKTSTLNAALNQMLEIREARYRKLAAAKPIFQKFLHGWLNRSDDLRKLVLSREGS